MQEYAKKHYGFPENQRLFPIVARTLQKRLKKYEALTGVKPIRVHGDYYLPDLEINEEEPTYGKYGIMRKQFLKEHRSARYQYLVLTGKLTEHLNQVDKEAREKVEMLVEQMAEQWGVTEKLKMQDQMEWVRKIQKFGFA